MENHRHTGGAGDGAKIKYKDLLGVPKKVIVTIPQLASGTTGQWIIRGAGFSPREANIKLYESANDGMCEADIIENGGVSCWRRYSSIGGVTNYLRLSNAAGFLRADFVKWDRDGIEFNITTNTLAKNVNGEIIFIS